MSGTNAYLTGIGIFVAIGANLLVIGLAGFAYIPLGFYMSYRFNVESTSLRFACVVLGVGFIAAAFWMVWHLVSTMSTLPLTE